MKHQLPARQQKKSSGIWPAIAGCCLLVHAVDACKAQEPSTNGLLSPAVPATGAFEFFEDGVLEAKIVFTSTMPGAGDNGLGLEIYLTAAAHIADADSRDDLLVGLSGTRYSGYTTTLPNDTGGIDYEALTDFYAIHLGDGRGGHVVTSELQLFSGDGLFDPATQPPPATVFLSGGTDAVVPEPTTALTCVAAIDLGLSWRLRPPTRQAATTVFARE